MQDEPYQVRGLFGVGMGVRVGEREHSAGGRPLQGAEQPSPVRRAALCPGAFPCRSPRPRGWTPWCPIWLKSCSWKTRPASRWRWGCWCGTTRTSGESPPPHPHAGLASCCLEPHAPVPSSPPSCLRGEPCHPLGTVPSSQTSPCPAHLSASASLSSWAAFPSPGWPGLVWPVCPGFGLCLHHGPLPNAETLPALHLNALGRSQPGSLILSIPKCLSFVPGPDGSTLAHPTPLHPSSAGKLCQERKEVGGRAGGIQGALLG
uniref:Uncharacterized protein n=1 Tax=Ursus maritimus TaxID=29073 RepID=A0A452VFU3_URSMA